LQFDRNNLSKHWEDKKGIKRWSLALLHLARDMAGFTPPSRYISFVICVLGFSLIFPILMAAWELEV
jgi:hypothetical protein